MEINEWVETITRQLSVERIQKTFQALLAKGEDPGGGIGGFRFLKYWMADPSVSEDDLVNIYLTIKPALKKVIQEIPSIYFFEAD